ncbi:MAG: ABC transporter ATP-binding protein [Arachnia sp.]
MNPPLIEFDAVSREYPAHPPVRALHECSLTIDRGDFMTVFGPSGSGKSTWLGLAGLLDRPTSGSIRFNGIQTQELGQDQRAALRSAHLGFVFQAFFLLPDRTVAENVRLPLIYQATDHSQRDDLVDAAIEKVGLAGRRSALARQLSGGEMQRTAIARALVNRPPLLLCDEPTGNLDSANSARIMETLRQLNQDGIAIVVVSHDPTIAAAGDRSLHILDGIASEQD